MSESFFERDSSNLKPSELPKDTIIEPDGWGRWIKVEGNRWEEVDVPDAFFPEYIYDAGAGKRQEISARTLEPTDKVFTDFKIIAYPAALVERIAGELAAYIQHDWHTDDTWVSVIREAIKDLKKIEEHKPRDLTPELARELGMIKDAKDDKKGAGPASPGTDES